MQYVNSHASPRPPLPPNTREYTCQRPVPLTVALPKPCQPLCLFYNQIMKAHPDSRLLLGADVFCTLHTLITADILVTSHSSFRCGTRGKGLEEGGRKEGVLLILITADILVTSHSSFRCGVGSGGTFLS